MTAESLDAKASRGGEDLIQTLSLLTGLPKSVVSEQINQILSRADNCDNQDSGTPVSLENITVEKLREALIHYLDELSFEDLPVENLSPIGSNGPSNLQ